MDETIEAVHELNLVHVTDYDGNWEGFSPGNPVEGAEDAASKLVTVRALESTLDITEEDAGRTRIIDDDELESELEETRTRVNEIDDRRSELQTEIREIEEKIGAARPFAALGIDLDLLLGYDSLTVAVGEGDADEIESSLAESEAVDSHELYAEGRYVALFLYPAVDIEEALVGTAFTEYEIPDLGNGEEATSPESYIEELTHRKQRLESELETVRSQIAELKHEVAGFLLAAEEKLSIEVQKREAPLTFAVTENAFVAEGWVPSEQVDDLVGTLDARIGDHVEVDELERASYEDGHAHEREELDDAEHGEAVADGGHEMSGGSPPVIQDNRPGAKPFEMLVGVINRPKYSELDPTLVLFLTFPIFFGFMIGDVGYGILYMLMGWFLLAKFDSPGFRSLGGVAVWAGICTAIFGVLYGEFFGLHELGYIVWGEGGSPMDKGLEPASIAFAWAWLVISLVIGLVHLSIGYVFGFLDDLSHGIADAVTENVSWLMLMLGAWVWVFSTHLQSVKPNLLFTTFNAEGATVAGNTVGAQEVAYELGFAGFSETVGIAAGVIGLIGLVLLVYGEGGIGLLESLNVFVNVLSYTRIAAVLLAKAGMAFVVNLLVLGAYQDSEGGVHFIYNNYDSLDQVHGDIMFSGLLNGAEGAMFVVAILAGALIFVVGHVLVLLLGITSAGLQGIRLEYVEFFNKFYDGGGKPYRPFGYERRYTTED
ncbi:MAG: V-type ATP synthase subunit I [Halobacteriota archaeon]|uniref:V-type ATP synthase subunit I n=1 Tax=Natronomonas sp. TaxID=2184060 RepID=UPI003975A7B3